MIPVWLKLVGVALAYKVLLDTVTEDKDEDMYNCHDDILTYHDEKVTLPTAEQGEMRNRRNTNRQRLENGLMRDGEPAPTGFQSQGSYVHRTMVQHKERDYDIDDGVYFWKDDLKGPKGGDKSAGEAKEMVRKALHDERFSRPPEVRTHCVRVYYDAGYHVDVPVYRKVKTKDVWGEEQVHHEIASSDWKKSEPAEVNRWFKRENEKQSPDTTNGRQLRRETRLNKAFARSRESWRARIATGFTITTLIVNGCYRPNAAREDKALYETMVAMRDRLNWDLEVKHPTVEGEMLTSDSDDARTKFLREKLDWAIGELSVLFDHGCTREQALKAWSKVFSTTFFTERLDAEKAAVQKSVGVATASVGAGVAAGILIKGAERAAAEKPVDKRGGGRYA